MNNISQLRICIERPLPHEAHIFNHIVNNSNSDLHASKLKAAFLIGKIWPNNRTITIKFIEDGHGVKWTPLNLLEAQGEIDPIEHEIRKLSPIQAVTKIIKDRIQPVVSLNFVFADKGSPADIRIGFDPNNGSWSNIGTDALGVSQEQRTVNYGWLDAGTIMHEFGHVIGEIHEHQNSRGNQIEWNVPKVLEWAKETQGWDEQTTRTNILDKYKIDQINGSQFDPNSIMLYFFPGSLTLNDKGTHMNLKLSELDIEWMQKMYPGKGEPAFYSGMSIKSKRNYIIIGLVILVVIVAIVVLVYKYKYRKNKN